MHIQVLITLFFQLNFSVTSKYLKMMNLGKKHPFKIKEKKGERLAGSVRGECNS